MKTVSLIKARATYKLSLTYMQNKNAHKTHVALTLDYDLEIQ